MKGYVPKEDFYNKIEDYLHSKNKFFCIKILNMCEISQNVPQFDHIEKRFSGSRILRSQFLSRSALHMAHHNMIPFEIPSYIASKILDLQIQNHNILKAVKQNLMLIFLNQTDINQIICPTLGRKMTH